MIDIPLSHVFSMLVPMAPCNRELHARNDDDVQLSKWATCAESCKAVSGQTYHRIDFTEVLTSMH